MKHRHRPSKGLTLMELLVASTLIGVVTLGAAGVLIGMRGIQGSSRLGSFLVMHSAAVISHIQHNALQACGYQVDPGIVLSPGSTPRYYSFRQDVDASLAPNSTPESYSDDTWLIYVHDVDNNTLSWCRQASVGGSAPTAGCLSTLTELSRKIDELTLTFTANSSNFHLSIELDTISDPAAASDPMDNPTYSLDTRVTPPAHTW